MASDEQLGKLEEKYDGYTVNDRDGDKIGKVDELFVDETDREEYIGVKMGLFGLSGTTLIPMEVARVNEQDRAIEVSEPKERVKDAPTYSNDDEVNDEFEDRIRSYFGVGPQGSSAERGSYGIHAGGGSATEGVTREETDREGHRDREGGREEGRMERGEREEYGDRGDQRGDREGREEGRIERAEPGSRDVEPRGERESREPGTARSDEERGWQEEGEESERMRVRRRTRREWSSSFEEEEEEEHFGR
ncbi:MAG: PRC-barrel domain-containing protein [Actinobacteria bacterium]|nr:PRC-barrel domain-containing protein [Actinomycetota bacterium]MCA1740201.1 PRC-barrel domain-containing protein [Actinomycetota bacterium]